MKWMIALSVFLGLAAPVLAESCNKSREYILEGLAGEITKPAESYQELFKVCVEALTLVNVKDAYVLKDGTIAILPTSNTVFATAETLAQFCQRFPNGFVRFLTPEERRRVRTIGYIALSSSTGATACTKIRGVK
jgi:hypothetical protein